MYDIKLTDDKECSGDIVNGSIGLRNRIFIDHTDDKQRIYRRRRLYILCDKVCII